MNALKKLISQLLVALTFTSCYIHAAEAEQRTPFGDRVATEEQRESLYDFDGEEEETQTQELWGISAYYPIDYSKTSIQDVGYLGHTVVLPDQSVWTVRPKDGKKVVQWNEAAKTAGVALNVFVTSNDNWFFDRDYLYRIVNIGTGEAVYCNMSQSPFLSASTWIHNINFNEGWVELTDNSGNYLALTLSSSDRAIYEDWMVNDNVFIGRNVRWGSSYYPYLLINIPTLTHARCNK